MPMAVTGQNITIAAGDAVEVDFIVTGFTTLGSATVKWAAARRWDGAPIILKSSTGTDVTIADLTVTLALKSSDTLSMEGKYAHELRIYDGGSEPTRVTKGYLRVEPAITNQST